MMAGNKKSRSSKYKSVEERWKDYVKKSRKKSGGYSGDIMSDYDYEFLHFESNLAYRYANRTVLLRKTKSGKVIRTLESGRKVIGGKREKSKPISVDVWANAKKIPKNAKSNIRIKYHKLDEYGKETRVKYFFEEIRASFDESALVAMHIVGEKIVKYMRQIMRPGTYRPYISKRQRRYGNRIIAKKLSDAAYRETGPEWQRHLTPKEARKKWVRLSGKEAYRYWPSSSVIVSGTSWVEGTKFGETHPADSARLATRVKYLRHGGMGVIHYSSAPGRPPAPDTEVLKESLEYGVYKAPNNPKVYRLYVGAFTPYAKLLEFGSPKARIAPRPYLRRSVEKFQGEIGAIVAKTWRSIAGEYNVPQGFAELDAREFGGFKSTTKLTGIGKPLYGTTTTTSFPPRQMTPQEYADWAEQKYREAIRFNRWAKYIGLSSGT